MLRKLLPTQERLQELLGYDETTGLLYWKQSRGRVKAGSKAGSLSKTTGYYYVQVDGNRSEAHRLIWRLVTGEIPNEIDHKNGKGQDNRFFNLRDVTHGVNLQNSAVPKDNVSGCVGVSWHKPTKRWQAQIQVDNKYVPLGYFVDYDAAVAKRKQAQAYYRFGPQRGEQRPVPNG